MKPADLPVGDRVREAVRLVSKSEYVWSEETGKFAPKPEGMTAEDVYAANKKAALTEEERELWLTPSSWGLSMESLRGILTELPAQEHSEEGEGETLLGFGQRVKGEDADFLYLKLDGSGDPYHYILVDNIFDAVQPDPSAFSAALMKKVYNPGVKLYLSWTDDEGNGHSMKCDYGRGELLIPLGSGSGWLMNSHDGVTLSMEKDGETLPLPAVTEARLYKLREVE